MFCPPFWHGGCLEKQECPRMQSCHGKGSGSKAQTELLSKQCIL